MNYVQFHVGDWDSSTRLLKPVEKGIYIDLLMLYYSVERPLMRSECDRIARAYTEEERDALAYVLGRFFDLAGDSYSHQRCDKEIAACREKSAKAAKSAQARWNKASRASSKSDADALAMQNGSTCSAVAPADGMRTHSERNADGMLTSNQEPITNKEPVVEKPSDFCPTVDDYESEQAPEPVPEAAGVKRVKLFPFPDSLPEEWATEAAKRRPDVSAEEVFFKLQVWLKDRQPAAKRTMAQWLRQFLQWITSERILPSSRDDGTAEEHTARLEKLFAELGR